MVRRYQSQRRTSLTCANRLPRFWSGSQLIFVLRQSIKNTLIRPRLNSGCTEVKAYACRMPYKVISLALKMQRARPCMHQAARCRTGWRYAPTLQGIACLRSLFVNSGQGTSHSVGRSMPADFEDCKVGKRLPVKSLKWLPRL